MRNHREHPLIMGQLEAQLILVNRDLARLEEVIEEKILQNSGEKDKNAKELITRGLLEYNAQKAQYLGEKRSLENQISIS